MHCLAILLLGLAIMVDRAAGQNVTDSVATIRGDLAQRESGDLTEAEVSTFCVRALELADAATSRSRFWSALALVAELSQTHGGIEIERARARALRLLVDRSADSQRWSSLITLRFAPNFRLIPQQEWADEMATYDELVDELLADSTDERVQIELLYSKAHLRVSINRLRP